MEMIFLNLWSVLKIMLTLIGVFVSFGILVVVLELTSGLIARKVFSQIATDREFHKEVIKILLLDVIFLSFVLVSQETMSAFFLVNISLLLSGLVVSILFKIGNKVISPRTQKYLSKRYTITDKGKIIVDNISSLILIFIGATLLAIEILYQTAEPTWIYLSLIVVIGATLVSAFYRGYSEMKDNITKKDKDQQNQNQ